MGNSLIFSIITLCLTISTLVVNCIAFRVKNNEDARYFKVQYIFSALIVITETLLIIGIRLGWK